MAILLRDYRKCVRVCEEGPPARRLADRVLASRVCVAVCRACAVCSRRVRLLVACDSLSYWCGRVVCCVLYMNFFLVPIICGVLWQFVAVRGNLWQFVAVRGSLRFAIVCSRLKAVVAWSRPKAVSEQGSAVTVKRCRGRAYR